MDNDNLLEKIDVLMKWLNVEGGVPQGFLKGIICGMFPGASYGVTFDDDTVVRCNVNLVTEDGAKYDLVFEAGSLDVRITRWEG